MRVFLQKARDCLRIGFGHALDKRVDEGRFQSGKMSANSMRMSPDWGGVSSGASVNKPSAPEEALQEASSEKAPLSRAFPLSKGPRDPLYLFSSRYLYRLFPLRLRLLRRRWLPLIFLCLVKTLLHCQLRGSFCWWAGAR